MVERIERIEDYPSPNLRHSGYLDSVLFIKIYWSYCILYGHKLFLSGDIWHSYFYGMEETAQNQSA
jgi:hypothetical protein